MENVLSNKNSLKIFLDLEKISYQDHRDLTEYHHSTYKMKRLPEVVVYPKNESEVVKLSEFAEKSEMGIHIVSKGLNWGYGSRGLTPNKQIQVNLKYFDHIALNEDNATVYVEAAISQKDLFDYISAHTDIYTMSVTGASPNSSIVGNTLTNGYGNGQHVVRWDNVEELNIVYSGKFINIKRASPEFEEWKKRILKSDDIIVLGILLSLPRIPSFSAFTYIGINKIEDLKRVLFFLDQKRQEGVITGNASFFTKPRLLAELLKTKKNAYIESDIMSDQEQSKLEYLLPECWRGRWNLILMQIAEDENEIKKMAEKVRDGLADIKEYIEQYFISKEEFLHRRDNIDYKKIGKIHPTLQGRIDTFMGIVRQGSVPMCYWYKEEPEHQYDLDRDGCGIIWLALLIHPSQINAFDSIIQIVESELEKHELEKFYVIDSINKDMIYQMVAIIFDKENEIQHQNALKVYQNAAKALEELNIIVYRKPLEIYECKDRD
jgi:4-cresol dehydrogenase (hydroxylating)